VTLTPTEWLIGIGGLVVFIGVIAGFLWLNSIEDRVERARPWTYWTTFAILAVINHQIWVKTGWGPVSLIWMFAVAAVITIIIPHAMQWLWKMVTGR